MAKTRSSPKGKGMGATMPMPESERQSLRIEKIDNGYLAHHSTEGPKGYQTKTVFHAKKPVVNVSADVPKAKRGSK